MELLVDLLIGPGFRRIFLSSAPVEPDLAERLVDFVLQRPLPTRLGAARAP